MSWSPHPIWASGEREPITDLRRGDRFFDINGHVGVYQRRSHGVGVAGSPHPVVSSQISELRDAAGDASAKTVRGDGEYRRGVTAGETASLMEVRQCSLSDEQYEELCARRRAYKREYWRRPEVKARRNERRRRARATRREAA
jgi:hypothetical protein